MNPLDLVAAVDTWPRAMVACTLVVTLALLSATRRTRRDVADVKASLHTTNGGSHAKDAFNRIEADVAYIRRDVGGMRSELRHANGRIDHLDRRLDQHLDGKETR